MEQEDKIGIQVKEHGIVLVGGIFILGFSLFILVMGLCYPSGGGNRLVFALVLFLMMVCGVMAHSGRDEFVLCKRNWEAERIFTE